MTSARLVLLLAIASAWLGTPSFARADCNSIQAQCAVKAGGRCDAQTGHWCYGRSRTGENCGGSPAAYRSCMAAHGVQVYGPQVPKAIGEVATASNPGKCTSIQAQCAMELGGTCDAKTGSWCYGHVYARNCGGGPTATAQFTACLSRKLGPKQ